MNIRSEIERGVSLLQSGNLQSAEKVFKDMLKVNSRHPDIFSLLGVVASRKGSNRDAVRFIKKAIKLAPKVGLYQRNLGLALTQIGKNREAITAFKRAISLDEGDAWSHNDLGVIYGKLGKTNAAIKEYRKAIKKDPSHFNAFSNLGSDLSKIGMVKQAITALEKSIEINPDYYESYYNLGVVLEDSGQAEKAIAAYRCAIALNVQHADSYNNLGNILKDQNDIDEAIIVYRKSISIDSNSDNAYNGLGVALRAQGDLDEAVAVYRKALTINPQNKEIWIGLGIALSDQGNLDEAIGSYNNALNIDPNYSDALWNSSLALLSQGIFNDGWKRYEHGRFSKNYPRRIIALPYPLWSGESLGDKVILVTAEQGVGDEIMFASCMHDLISMHPKRIILECDKRLEPIFRRSFPLVYVAGNRNEEDYDWLSQFDTIDMQVAIGTLPKFFRIDISSFAGGNPYLSVDLLDSKKWKRRFSKAGSRLKIGVSWKGGVNRILQRNRSIELEVLAPVLSLDAFFVNLQYGDCTDEISKFMHSRGICIHDWDDVNPLINLDNFAAEISALDLVISVDNSTVHIAGALGIPVWVLIPYSPDWRWMTGRTDSPWYKTVRLFRQKNFGDWSDVVDEIYSELQVPIR